jgi:hypothetical protein
VGARKNCNEERESLGDLLDCGTNKRFIVNGLLSLILPTRGCTSKIYNILSCRETDIICIGPWSAFESCYERLWNASWLLQQIVVFRALPSPPGSPTPRFEVGCDVESDMACLLNVPFHRDRQSNHRGRVGIVLASWHQTNHVFTAS